VGKNNYGHPSKDVIKRYLDNDTQLMVTQEGYIKIVILPLNISWIHGP
jgi:beta-lactamase superfamily II metal-dependent hydrolase